MRRQSILPPYFIVYKSSRHLIVVKCFLPLIKARVKISYSSSGKEFKIITVLSSSSILTSTLTRSVKAWCYCSYVHRLGVLSSSGSDKASSSIAVVTRCSSSDTFSIGSPTTALQIFHVTLVLDLLCQTRTDQTIRYSVHLVPIFF